MPPIYPNSYVLLVAPPGIGKGVAINAATYFLRKAGSLHIAPDTLTKAALVDELKDSHKYIKAYNLEYHSLIIPSVEFGALVPEWNATFLNSLNDLFDCRHLYKERTRGTGKIEIANPQISIIGGTQPDYLAVTLPPEAWGTGFCARNIMVFSKENKPQSMFSGKKRDPALHDALLADMKRITQLYGEFTWSPDASRALDEWQLGGCQPKPEVAKLEHYATRRPIHVAKLMLVASLSRGDNLEVDYEDFETALDWLLEAERTMPDIFRHMTMTGDTAIQDDAAKWCQEQEDKRKTGLGDHTIINFLRTRMKVHEVAATLKTMKDSHLLRQSGFDKNGNQLWTAKPEVAPPTITYTSRPQSTRHHALTIPSPPLIHVPARYILRVTEEEDHHSIPEDEEYYPNGSE